MTKKRRMKLESELAYLTSIEQELLSQDKKLSQTF